MFSYADDLDIPQPDSESREKNRVVEYSEMGINVGVHASNKIFRGLMLALLYSFLLVLIISHSLKVKPFCLQILKCI